MGRPVPDKPYRDNRSHNPEERSVQQICKSVQSCPVMNSTDQTSSSSSNRIREGSHCSTLLEQTFKYVPDEFRYRSGTGKFGSGSWTFRYLLVFGTRQPLVPDECPFYTERS